MEDWTALNRLNWDERAAPHAASPDYAVERLVAEPDLLSDVVRFDVPRLPDLRGTRGVHLQCHIGTDTLSLHRLGARMTGLDFSAPALAEARALAARAGAAIDYVEAPVDRALEVLEPGGFDLVYTGVGAITWLPDVGAWARTVAGLLRPGGRLLLRDGHPMLWTLDDERQDALVVRYPYFETSEPVVFDEPGTYVRSEHEFVHTRTASWNHGIGEVVGAVLAAGLRLDLLEEHRSVPWEALPGRMSRGDDGEWRLVRGADLVPLSFTLGASKHSVP